MRHTSTFGWILFGGVVALGGCNMITGAGDVVTLSDDDDGGATNGPGVGAGGATTGNATTGAATTGNGGAATTGGTTNTATGTGTGPAPDTSSADGVNISKVALYQGVQRVLVNGGQAVTTGVPIVAGKDAVVRVYYNVDGAYNNQPVQGVVTIDGTAYFSSPETVSGASADAQLTTTLNIDVPGAAVTSGSNYRVDIVQPEGTTSGTNAAARFPAELSGTTGLQAENAGSLKVVLVPVQYNADGSGRLPDTGAAQLQLYTDQFYARYPASNMDLSVRNQPLAWPNTIGALNGNSWGNLLNAISNLRGDDGVANDVYYYGIFEPASTFGNFCNQGCIAGLGFVGGANQGSTHAAIGLGFNGMGSVETALHEIGHTHGRNHAPCGGASGVDPSYPHSGARLGTQGMDIITGQLKAANSFVDMMSYCDPTWVSDYTYNALFNRIKTVNNAQFVYPAHLKNLTWQRAMVGEDGTLAPMTDLFMANPMTADPVAVEVDTTGGVETITAQFVRYDHIDGGVLYVPPLANMPLVANGIRSVTINNRVILR